MPILRHRILVAALICDNASMDLGYFLGSSPLPKCRFGLMGVCCKARVRSQSDHVTCGELPL